MKKSAFSFIIGASLSILLLSSFHWLPSQSLVRKKNYTDNFSEKHPSEKLGYCYTQNKTFQHGERITYKLFYKLKFIWLPAGEVVFSVNDNMDGTLHLSAKGRTYKSYEWFFKVRNSYECDIDKSSLLPTNSLRKIREGKNRRLFERVNFDQRHKKAVSQYGCSEEKAQESTIELEDCMHDLLSVLYYTRNIDLNGQQPGSKFPINVFMDQEVKSLNLIYKGKENRKRIKGRGRFNTIRFTPESIPGRLFEKEKNKGKKMDVWVSDDQNRLPLLIRTPLAGGQIKAVLKKHEGLRYDLTSKVK